MSVEATPTVQFPASNGVMLKAWIKAGDPTVVYQDWRAPEGKCPPALTVQDLGQWIDRLEYLRGLMA